MAKKRVKTKDTVIPSKLEAIEAHNEYAAASVKRDKTIAEKEAEIQKINEKYQPSLLGLGEELSKSLRKIQVWAESNKDLFIEKRSQDWGNAVIGYRTGTPKVTVRPGTINPETNKAASLKSIAAALDADELTAFLKTVVPTLDKNAITSAMKDRKSELAVVLSGYGLLITQDETFFIEVKSSETDIE